VSISIRSSTSSLWPRSISTRKRSLAQTMLRLLMQGRNDFMLYRKRYLHFEHGKKMFPLSC
jgi:hypothetical protein